MQLGEIHERGFKGLQGFHPSPFVFDVEGRFAAVQVDGDEEELVLLLGQGLFDVEGDFDPGVGVGVLLRCDARAGAGPDAQELLWSSPLYADLRPRLFAFGVALHGFAVDADGRRRSLPAEGLHRLADPHVVVLALRPHADVEDRPYGARGDLALVELTDGLVERVVDWVVDEPRLLHLFSFFPEVLSQPDARAASLARGGLRPELVAVAPERTEVE